ncbi:MAG: MFS transporter [Kiritimatiellaeota bacterium]|nr:MFS transporter [Kiritimatiellota bacterium]
MNDFARADPTAVVSQPPDGDSVRQRTMRLSIFEGSTWAVMAGCGEAFAAPFLIFLRASNWAVALLTSGPVLLGALAQLAGAWWVERTGQRRKFLAVTVMLQALLYAPLFLVPLLFPAAGVAAAVVFALLAIFCGNLPLPAWMSLMGDVIPETRRGDYLGQRFAIIFACLTGANLLGGLLLGVCQRAQRIWVGFGLLFGIALLARLTGAWLFTRHVDPPCRSSADDYFSFWAFLRRTPKSNFVKFAFFVALMNGATNVAAPFFTVYMLRDLHWTYTQFTLSIVAMFIAQAVFFRWWGRIGDRHGHRVVLVATGCLLPILPVIWALTSNFTILLGQQVLSGAAWSGFNLATQNFIFDAVSPRKRARGMAYFSLVNGFFTLLGGVVLGAWLATHLPSAYHLGPLRVTYLSPLPAVFVVSGVLRVLALLLLLPQFREVRPAEPVSPGALLLRLWSGEAFAGTLGFVATRLGGALRRRG